MHCFERRDMCTTYADWTRHPTQVFFCAALVVYDLYRSVAVYKNMILTSEKARSSVRVRRPLTSRPLDLLYFSFFLVRLLAPFRTAASNAPVTDSCSSYPASRSPTPIPGRTSANVRPNSAPALSPNVERPARGRRRWVFRWHE